MKWVLIYIAIAQHNSTYDRLEMESKELCEQRGIALLEVAKTRGLKAVAVCRNEATGEDVELKIPPKQPTRPTA